MSQSPVVVARRNELRKCLDVKTQNKTQSKQNIKNRRNKRLFLFSVFPWKDFIISKPITINNSSKRESLIELIETISWESCSVMINFLVHVFFLLFHSHIQVISVG